MLGFGLFWSGFIGVLGLLKNNRKLHDRDDPCRSSLLCAKVNKSLKISDYLDFSCQDKVRSGYKMSSGVTQKEIRLY